jgi:hypothetical protein
LNLCHFRLVKAKGNFAIMKARESVSGELLELAER